MIYGIFLSSRFPDVITFPVYLQVFNPLYCTCYLHQTKNILTSYRVKNTQNLSQFYVAQV